MCRTIEKGCRGGGNESDGARNLKGLTTSTCRARLKAGVSASSCRWSLDSPAQREAEPHAVRGRRSGGRGCPSRVESSRVDAAPAARAQQRARRSRGRGRELMPCSEEPPPRETSRTRAGFLFFDVAAEKKDFFPTRREGCPLVAGPSGTRDDGMGTDNTGAGRKPHILSLPHSPRAYATTGSTIFRRLSIVNVVVREAMRIFGPSPPGEGAVAPSLR